VRKFPLGLELSRLAHLSPPPPTQIHHPACPPRLSVSAPYRAAGCSYRHARTGIDHRPASLPLKRSCRHFASKSRRYSTTLGAIRSERRTYRQRQAAEHTRELLPDEQDTTLVAARWEFDGVTSPAETPPLLSPQPPAHANGDKRHGKWHKPVHRTGWERWWRRST
jgi:hypothetical protein